MCEHPSFDADVEVDRVHHDGLVPSTSYMVKVQVRCRFCGTRLAFMGVPMGLNWKEPTVSASRFELIAPARPDAHLTSLLGGDPDTAFPAPR